MKWALSIVVILAAGCSSRPAPPERTAVTEIPTQGNWFCQPGMAPGTWDCVQDARLASEPPAPRPLPSVAPPEPPPPLTIAEDDIASLPEPAGMVEMPKVPAEMPAEAPPLPPEPALPMTLDALPPGGYTIQLMAADSRRALEPWLARRDLGSAFVVPVERDGVRYQALLIGAYESEAAARQAVESLAVDVQALSPWVRSVRSLQRASERAQRLADSGVP
jgi:septal ring-binding cell division protein DamX